MFIESYTLNIQAYISSKISSLIGHKISVLEFDKNTYVTSLTEPSNKLSLQSWS